MSTYSMSDIVSLTNINAHTLRKWETRYNFIEPKRTETNIRVYTEEQLRLLLNIGILVRNGVKISHINKMSTAELHDRVSQLLLQSSPDDDIDALVICMLQMDEIKFTSIMDRHVLKSGLLTTITTIIYPFLNHVGVLWGTEQLIPAQEHFISNLIRQKILSAIEAISQPQKDAPKIVLFLLENEHHDIGLILAYYIAKKLGWKTYYLGQNVPLEDITQVQKQIEPQLMITMITIGKPQKFKKLVSSITDLCTTPLLVSGGKKIFDSMNFSNQIIRLKNPDEFIDMLNDIEKVHAGQRKMAI